MIPQRKLYGVWFEIVLIFEIRLPVFSYIVVYQRDRNDERNKSAVVGLDTIDELTLFVGRELLLEIPHEVVQDVEILFDGRSHFQGGGKKRYVF